MEITNIRYEFIFTSVTVDYLTLFRLGRRVGVGNNPYQKLISHNFWTPACAGKATNFNDFSSNLSGKNSWSQNYLLFLFLVIFYQ